MKSLLFFIFGIITAFFIVFLFVLGEENTEIITFSQEEECIGKKQFTVFQVTGDNMALASGDNGIVVFLTNKEGKYYYDEEIIKVPSKKCAKQIGLFKYKTKDDRYKTVPMVSIE